MLAGDRCQPDRAPSARAGAGQGAAGAAGWRAARRTARERAERPGRPGRVGAAGTTTAWPAPRRPSDVTLRHHRWL